MKLHLHLQAEAVGNKGVVAKRITERNLQATQVWNPSDPVPMDADAVKARGKPRDDRACYSCGRRGHMGKDCKAYGVTEVPTYPQHPLGVRPGQTHLPLLPAQNTYAQNAPLTMPVPSDASTIRAVNHIQTQQAWCLVLQVENNSINSRDRDEGNALVDIAYEVHWTDRNRVEKSDQRTVSSSPPNIIAARKHSLEHCRKSSCIPRLRVGSPPRVRSKRMRSAKPDCLWHRWWTRAIK